MSPAVTADRSVLHYGNTLALEAALYEKDVDGMADWMLGRVETQTTIPQTELAELKRLSVLKSYDILETPKESAFDSITSEAQKYFGTPIAVVSLVDLGRQWFKSIQGLDAAETPRCLAFCAHVVQRKAAPECCPVLVVPDATQDDRFKDNPLVVGGPEIRFYAGAPLISPEGPVLGSFCVIDNKPHPQGLTEEQKQRLQMFASEAVYSMIVRDPQEQMEGDE